MKNKRKPGRPGDTQNSRFGRMFLKNWLLVFLCIVIPLCLGVIMMQDYSKRSLLKEVDASIQRSADNTTSTINSLLTETCALLRKEIINDDVKSFLSTPATAPQSYNDVVTVRSVLQLVERDYRESLHFSVDAYSDTSERIISTLYRGQHYFMVRDTAILDSFLESRRNNPGQVLFAAPRTVVDRTGQEKRALTVYQVSKEASEHGFVSISIDMEKLISYITTNNQRSQGTYLLADQNGMVIMDTGHLLTDQTLDYLAGEADDFPVTREIDGQMMRVGVKELGLFEWKCVQLVPVQEIEASSVLLRNLLIVIILFGVLASGFISFFVTRRLFRPIRSILEMLENPTNEMLNVEEKEEYRYLLVQILELFQKNITLENAMAERVVALRNARAKALQRQLTPHFLNNVLQTINWIAIEETGQEHSRVSQAITLLADVIRIGKEQKTNFFTVADEIAYTQKFMELEQLRYGDDIVCHFDVDAQAEDMQIPCVSIQPLVENAILHGLQPTGEEGDIYVSVSRTDGNGLRIRVEDSGAGIRQEMIDRILTLMKQEYIYLGEHIGVINLFQRFRLLYGDACQFQIGRSQYGGTCVEIVTPELPGA